MARAEVKWGGEESSHAGRQSEYATSSLELVGAHFQVIQPSPYFSPNSNGTRVHY